MIESSATAHTSGTIRIATAHDAAAIHGIYAPSVTHGNATFETTLPGVATMAARIQARLQHYPWLVLEASGEVLAYASAARYRERAAYDWIAETSIYVRADAAGRGIAHRLYEVLLEALILQGINQAVGVITLPGVTSVALHERMGFAPAGVWRNAGFKLGQWWDVGLWQRELAAPATPPQPVIPFSQLAESVELRRLLAAR